MAPPRFFLAPPALDGARAGLALALPVPVSHHARRVLRLRGGDALVLFDGRGGEWPATLAGGEDAAARLGEHDPVERETRAPLVLVQSLVAQEKLDWIVEKAVELGVGAIAIAPAERSSVRMEPARLARRIERWGAIAIAAAEQSGRTRLPEVRWCADLPQALALAPPQARRYVLDPGAARSLAGAWRSVPQGQAGAVCCIGPEGGFSGREVEALVAAGCEPVGLGPRVLRTETAGLACLATLQAARGQDD